MEIEREYIQPEYLNAYYNRVDKLNRKIIDSLLLEYKYFNLFFKKSQKLRAICN